LENLDQVEVIEAALGRTNSRAEFFRGPNSATNSLLPRPASSRKQYFPETAHLTGGYFVDVVNLDEFCLTRGINEIDLLKLDLQGGELDALQGATSLLTAGSIAIIFSEGVFVPKYQDQPLLTDLWGFLLGYGYSLYSLEDIKIGPYDSEDKSLRQHQWNQCDAIFISSELREILERKG
jgi:FkbM family methyltransferase